MYQNKNKNINVNPFKDFWREWFSGVREFGHPSRILVRNADELISLIEKYNGVDPCYVSLYEYVDGEPVIDKVWLDFDGKGNDLKEVFLEVRRTVEYLRKRNIDPLVIFTGGRGFHIYIFFHPICLEYPRETLKRFLKLLVKDLNLKYVDETSFGDISRLVRIPYTQHEKTGLYCIPVADIYADISEILEQSKMPTLIKIRKSVSDLDKFLKVLDGKEIYNIPSQTWFDHSIRYLDLPCINQLFTEPLPHGKRRIKAGKFIAIAYYLDHNGDMTGFREVAKIFAERQRIDHPVKVSEIEGWSRGIYQLNQPITFNCGEIILYLRECKIKPRCDLCELNRLRQKQKQEQEEELKKKVYEKLKNMDLLARVRDELNKFIIGEEGKKELLYLLLLTNQSVFIKGDTSTGKNNLVEGVLKLFPEDYVWTISSATAKSLRWIDKDYIPILYIKEVPADLVRGGPKENFSLDLKLAMSDHILKITYTDASTRPPVTREKTLKIGSVVQTTTEIELPEDFENRCWIITTDSSEDLTRKILKYKAWLKTMGLTVQDLPVDPDIVNITRVLMGSTKVKIPYADILTEILAPYPRARRDIDKIFALVDAVTKINIAHRKTEDGMIVSEPQDAIEALNIAENTLTYMLSGLEPRLQSAYEAFVKIQEEIGEVSASLLAAEMNITRRTANKYLKALLNGGWIQESQRKGNTRFYILTEKMKNISRENIAKVKEKLLSLSRSPDHSI